MADAGYPTAIFVSGSGTNLAAVIAAVKTGNLPLDLRLVVSNRKDAPAVDLARTAGVPVLVEPFDRAAMTRGRYTRRLVDAAHSAGARLILLLGWMIVLSPEFLEAGFNGVLNLHPAWLPDDPRADSVQLPDGTTSPVFRGPHALRDAIAAGVSTTAATLIRITSEVDRGPVLARRPMELKAGESEAAALERLHAVERQVVREGVLRWLSENAARANPA